MASHFRIFIYKSSEERLACFQNFRVMVSIVLLSLNSTEDVGLSHCLRAKSEVSTLYTPSLEMECLFLINDRLIHSSKHEKVSNAMWLVVLPGK